MSRFLDKTFRFAIVALMLLLTGATPLFTLSIDADDDDDTPPITVEMNLVAPARKSVQASVEQASVQVSSTGHRETFHTSLFSSHHQPTLNPGMGSPQLVVPLRT
jgi:hypothetical protein